MPDIMNNVKTINSAVRTAMMLGACSVIGYGGYFGYNNYVKPSHDAQRAAAQLKELEAKYQQQSFRLS